MKSHKAYYPRLTDDDYNTLKTLDHWREKYIESCKWKFQFFMHPIKEDDFNDLIADTLEDVYYLKKLTSGTFQGAEYEIRFTNRNDAIKFKMLDISSVCPDDAYS